MDIEELFTKPYWVVDFLPEQVPKYSDGQFSRIEQYFLREPRLSELRRKFFTIILKLNCFFDISVLADPEGDWEDAESNPDPDKLYDLFVGKNASNYVMVSVRNEDTLIVSNKDDTCIAIYNPSERVLTLVSRIAAAEGLFLWKP